VPAGTPLHFSITSSGVMNSFFIPQLGSQIYAMAGMTTRLVLQADKPGTYIGRSVQFSGDGFSDMRFDVVSLEPSAFDDWVRQTRGAGGTLDLQSYTGLTKPGTVSQPSTYGAISPGLFQAAIQQAVK
jgi:cytochrome o ubiquinol oxidase subunit 2